MPEKTIHVFIHGTTFVEQTFLLKTEELLNMIGIPTTFFKEKIALERSDPLYKTRELLLDIGLVEVSHDTLNAYIHGTRCYTDERIATYPILAKFKQLLPSSDNQLFYTFGWKGTLLQQDRIKAGKDLYEALVSLKHHYPYDTIHFKLYTHSHGGALALYMALFEDTYKHGLSIDTLCFFGLPIQPETINYTQSPIFKTIINFYSQGDAVQTIDFVSTHAWQSYRRMSDFLSLPCCAENDQKKMYDVRLLVDGDEKALGHHSLWLYDKTTKILPCLDKLPIIAIAPSLIEMVESFETPHGDINISNGEALCS